MRKTSSRMVLSRMATQPNQVKSELRKWLGSQAHELDKKVGHVGGFTGQAPLSDMFEKTTGSQAIRLGLDYGQDFTPICMIAVACVCGSLGAVQIMSGSVSLASTGATGHISTCPKKKVLGKMVVEQQNIARRYLHNVSEARHLQCLLDGQAHAENLLSSLACAELSLENTWEVRLDQCALGLRSPKTDQPVLEPTRIVTSASGLVKFRCDGRHKHGGYIQGI